MVEGEKMSKSLGNFFTVADLRAKGVPGEVMQLAMLMTHYRSPIDWSEERFSEAFAMLEEWPTVDVEGGKPSNDVLAALADDLNTSLAVQHLNSMAELARNNESVLKDFAASARLIGVRNLIHGELSELENLYVSKLLEIRSQSKKQRDFERADRIRNLIQESGIMTVKDGKEKSDFDINLKKLLEIRGALLVGKNEFWADRVREKLFEIGVLVEDDSGIQRYQFDKNTIQLNHAMRRMRGQPVEIVDANFSDEEMRDELSNIFASLIIDLEKRGMKAHA